MEAEGGGLFAKGSFAAEAVEFLLVGEDGGIIGAAVFDEVMQDAGEFMGRGGDGFRSTEPGFHPAEEVAEGGLAALEALGGHAQGVGGAAFHIAGGDGEDAPACDAVIRAEAEPGGEVLGTGEALDAGADFAEEGADYSPVHQPPYSPPPPRWCFAGRAPG